MTAMTTLCVLNPTVFHPDPAKHLTIAKLSFGGTTVRIEHPRDIPVDDGPLVLYIVGHARPDVLLVPRGDGATGILTEKELVETVLKRRRNNPTLIIWDLCYARSFETQRRASWAGKPYVHIFSCESFEESWHTGEKGWEGAPPRCTLFSLALEKALADGAATWGELRDRVQILLGHVQHPRVLLPLGPADFGLRASTKEASADEHPMRAPTIQN
jgi:hypothetical protein